MSQRRRGEGSSEPIYSEADVAEFRERWEQAEKERQFQQQLVALNTRFDALPTLIEEIAKRIVLDVTTKQKAEADSRRRGTLGFIVAVGAVIVVLVVPIETAIVTHLYP